MKTKFLNWINQLGQLPAPVLSTLIFLMALGIGGIDYLTGFEWSFSFLYLIPVGVTTWWLGRNPGLAMAFLCALIWLGAVLLNEQPFSVALIPYWNMLSRTVIFGVVSLLVAELHLALDFERSLSRTDPLTGILNRRAFYHMVALELARIQRNQRPATFLYIDIDNFKQINDERGHQVGDQVLERVAQTILKNVRAIDSVARLGGDEFGVLLPETGESGAKTLAPRLRWHLLAEMGRFDWPVTFSIGALTCLDSLHDVEETIRLADQVMYDVKRGNKDGIAYAVMGNGEAPKE